jgi:hypothetical protein
MIVFSSLQIRRGVRVLLDNATATINPGQKVGLVGKKRLRQIHAAVTVKKRDKRRWREFSPILATGSWRG